MNDNIKEIQKINFTIKPDKNIKKISPENLNRVLNLLNIVKPILGPDISTLIHKNNNNDSKAIMELIKKEIDKT